MPRQPITNRIEVQIAGRPEDGGAVRLDALYNFLEEVKRTLAAVEREVTDSERPTLAFKIVTLTYASPIRCVLEPVVVKATQRSLGNSVIKRFNREVKEIETGKARLRTPRLRTGIEPATLEQFEKLAMHRKQGTQILAGLENDVSPITSDFESLVRKLLGNVYKSRGSFRGRLEAVNIHASPCVVQIYPVVGPVKIRCTYPKGRFPRIGEYLDRQVDINGILKFRGDDPHPYEIEIEEITVLSARDGGLVAASLVASMPDITGGQDITSYLRELRHD